MWCIHHDTLVESVAYPIEARVHTILVNKPKSERARRLRELRPVKGKAREVYLVRQALIMEGYTTQGYDEYMSKLTSLNRELDGLHKKAYPHTTWNGYSIFKE